MFIKMICVFAVTINNFQIMIPDHHNSTRMNLQLVMIIKQKLFLVVIQLKFVNIVVNNKQIKMLNVFFAKNCFEYEKIII